MIKHLSFSELPTIGINPLTGESCAYMQRILCDLNEDGVTLIADWLGIPAPAAALASSWNSAVGYKPAVASIMLDRTMFPALMRFTLMRKGYQYVLGRPEGTDWMGFSDADFERYPDLKRHVDNETTVYGRLYRNPRPLGGSRNEHAFTGRTL